MDNWIGVLQKQEGVGGGGSIGLFNHSRTTHLLSYSQTGNKNMQRFLQPGCQSSSWKLYVYVACKIVLPVW